MDNGASATAGSDAFIGFTAGSTGSITVDGASATDPSTVTIGGNVDIATSGTAFVSSPTGPSPSARYLSAGPAAAKARLRSPTIPPRGKRRFSILAGMMSVPAAPAPSASPTTAFSMSPARSPSGRAAHFSPIPSPSPPASCACAAENFRPGATSTLPSATAGALSKSPAPTSSSSTTPSPAPPTRCFCASAAATYTSLARRITPPMPPSRPAAGRLTSSATPTRPESKNEK